jgi:murein DD-endopeptidase MepM/ murein hydrolase activator NlpD
MLKYLLSTVPLLFSLPVSAQILAPSDTLGTWSQTPGSGDAWVEPLPSGFRGSTGLPYNVWRAVPADASLGRTIKFGDLTNTYLPNGAQYFQDRNKSINDLLSSQGKSTKTTTIEDSSYASSLTLGEIIRANNGQVPASLQARIRQSVSSNPSTRGTNTGTLRSLGGAGGALIKKYADLPDELKEVPIGELASGDFQGALDAGIQRGAQEALKNLPQSWQNLPVGSIASALTSGNYKAALSQGLQFGGQKLASYILSNDSLKNLPIGAIAKDIPISDLGNVANAPLSTLPRIGSQYISKIPGLKDAPIIQSAVSAAIPLVKGDIAVKLDIAYAGKREQPDPNAFTGGTPNNVPTPTNCKINSAKKGRGKTNNCAHFQMGYMNMGINKGRYKGQQMVDGQVQWAKGGKGPLAKVNKEWEPTGWKPFGDANGYNPAKLSLKNIKEHPGGNTRAAADIQLDLQLCVDIPFTGKKTCSPHMIPVPTTFKARQNEWLLLVSSSTPKFVQDAINALNNSSAPCDVQQSASNDPSAKNTLDPVVSSKAPQSNLKQYLARIAAGESSGGVNLGAVPDSGSDAPYGEYQFRGSTRQAVLAQYPTLDAWSQDKTVRDKATLAWIGLYGNEIGVDILGSIQKGDFTTADKALGKNQFTSLPGGADASPIWSSPANLTKFGAGGSAASTGSITCTNASGGTSLGAYTGKTSGTLMRPVASGPVTSDYGPRVSPGGIGSTNHRGVDYGVPTGTAVVSSANGKIVYQGWYGGYGNTVFVDHGNGVMTQYSHLNGFVGGLGTPVPQGATIAFSGNTGNSTGPHLHYAVLTGTKNGNHLTGDYVNPMTMLNTRN